MSLNRIQKAARRLSDTVKTDKDFQCKVDQIAKCSTKDTLMVEFLNLRMEKDPEQLFRVLQLQNPLTAVVR